jgi:ketosteroid isomerase-like protein
MAPRHLLFGIACTLAATSVTAASPEQHRVARSVTAFVQAVNVGDEKAALAHLTHDVSIIEDLAPYHWQGPRAGAQWMEAMFRNGQRMGMSEIQMNLGEPTRLELNADRAYEIIPGVVTLKGRGGNLRESGSLTFALRKVGPVWKIAAFSWSGERAH